MTSQSEPPLSLLSEAPAEQLERAWHSGQPLDVHIFLARIHTLSTTEVVEVLLVDQRERWRCGERPAAEEYLQRYPAVRADANGALDVVYGEFLRREERGERPDLADYQRQFPELAESLRIQVGLHRALPAEGEPTGPPTPDYPSSAAPERPTVLGLEVLGELGRGGMGVVYQARQVALNRLVALKVILAGARADADQLRRFRAEALAVARLRHPNFVQVYDHGEMSDGCPYLVLEYVEGGTLAQKTGGNPQPPAAAAQVVETLAAAMHHAHQQRLLHRDLKPANVLRTADGVYKITDFGLVKQLDAGAAQTGGGALAGTPTYMAPEQVCADGREVGPAADVYALGVILYELLTGRPPFQGDSVLDVLRQVQQAEPLPPRRLRPRVPRDLETVCLKCLHKEPARRYATAAALAEDLRRFQAGEPIAARPVGAAERAWRWCRRSPKVATLAALLVLAVVGGLVGVTGLWLRAETNLDEARANLQMAIDAVDQFCTRVSEDRRLQEHDLRPLRRQLLQTAVDFHERFVAKRRGDMGLEAELARAYARLGRLTAEIDAKPRAVAFYEEARSLLEHLTRAHPEEPAYQLELAQCHGQLGQHYHDTGEPGKAEDALRRAQQFGEQLARTYPDRPAYRQQLADTWIRLNVLYQRNGRAAEAEASLKEALALCEALTQAHPDVAGYQFDLARHHLELGQLLRNHFIRRWREAETANQTAADLLRDLCRRDSATVDYRAALVVGLRELGKIHLLTKRREEAESLFKEGIETQEHLAGQHANVTQYHATLAHLYDDLGMLYQQSSRLSEAKAPWTKALKIWERLVRQDLDASEYAAYLGKSQNHIAALLRYQGDPAAALDWQVQSIRTLAEVLERNPQQFTAREFLVHTHLERTALLTELNRHAEALADWDRVLELDKSLLRPWYRLQRALTLARLGEHATATQEARQTAEGLSPRTPAARRNFADAARVYCLAISAVQRTTALPEAERARLAEEYAARALELLQQAVQAGYRDLDSLQKSSEFDPLRSRADFANLVTELQKLAKGKAK